MSYNRLAFIKFMSQRERKYKGVAEAEGESDNLDQKLVSDADIQLVLAQVGGVKCALMGGAALRHHGYPRATVAIELLASQAALPQLTASLHLEKPRPLSAGGVAGTTDDGLKVRIVAPNWPWVPEALADAEGANVLSKPFLVLAYLWAARSASDDNDAYQMLKRMTFAEKDRAGQLVRKYLPDEVGDYETMVGFADYF